MERLLIYHKVQLGQGLIETLIIILFIGVSILGMAKFARPLNYNAEVSHQQGDALIAGLNQLETLKNFSVLNSTSGYRAYADIDSGTSTTTVGNTTYTLTWTVSTSTIGYEDIDLTIAWTDRVGTARSIALSTNIASVDPAGSLTVMA